MRGGIEVLSNVIASQHELHAKFGGVVPEIASRAHIERIGPVINEALETAGVAMAELDAVAVGHRPGLIGSLLVGVSAAKALAWSLGKPLIGVDHVRAHLYAAALEDDSAATTGRGFTGAEPPAYPALGLVVSGGHTSLYALRGPLEMRLIGRTIDDAVGEAFDKAAAILGLGFPGGPAIDRAARAVDPGDLRFPQTLLGPDSLDFSFSGLKTAVLYHVRGKPQGRGAKATFERDVSDLSELEKAQVVAAFQEAAVGVVLRKLERALDQLNGTGDRPRCLIVGGGVSANSVLRERVMALGERRGLPVHLPRMAHCIDNAAMIAGLAHHHLSAGQTADLGLEAVATTRV